jgi:hypothetical protein
MRGPILPEPTDVVRDMGRGPRWADTGDQRRFGVIVAITDRDDHKTGKDIADPDRLFAETIGRMRRAEKAGWAGGKQLENVAQQTHPWRCLASPSVWSDGASVS